jgi:very-short-patch-repair endonuclease
LTADRRLRIRPEVKQRARELRQPQTPAEQKLWALLRGRNLAGYKFRRQHPIGNFIVDFYCPQAKLVIEVDGDIHAAQQEYDAARTVWLQERGYRVIRFANREIFDRPDAVGSEILKMCSEVNQSKED